MRKGRRAERIKGEERKFEVRGIISTENVLRTCNQ
jgi:hypothetical protein